MTEHHLKTWPEFFTAVVSGDKTFEVREDDRGFEVGDVLVLREYAVGVGFSGYEVRRRVTYIMRGGAFGLEPSHVVLAIRPEDESQ